MSHTVRLQRETVLLSVGKFVSKVAESKTDQVPQIENHPAPVLSLPLQAYSVMNASAGQCCSTEKAEYKF